MMESSLLIVLTSTWPTQGPYDIHTCIHSVFEEEGPNPSGQCESDSNTCHGRAHKVILTPSSQSDGPCFLNLRCQPGAEMVSAVISSNARHAEIHSDTDGYVRTVRGEKIAPREERDEEGVVVYRKEITLDRPQTSFALKFVSLADTHHLYLHSITAILRKTVTSDDSATSNLPRRRGNIDMDRVRDLLSSQQQPISQRAERLMHSIEQYQTNQSSVMRDMQEAVTEYTAGQKSGGGDTGMMGRMASLLSSLSRTQLSEQMAPSPEAITKMMSSLAGGAGESPVNESVYGALKVMCKDVTNLRSAERQGKKEKPCDQDDQQVERHKEGAESKPIQYASVEDPLKPLICSMEKRIMESLDAKLESLQAHIDLRLNRIETALSEILLHRTEKRDSNEPHQVHKTLCKLPEGKEIDGHADTEIKENLDT